MIDGRVGEQRPSRALWLGAAVGLGALASVLGACGMDSGAADDSGLPAVGAGGTTGGTGMGASSGGSTSISTGGTNGNTAGTGPTPPPPEMELESAFEAPVATDRFVWAANPSTGRVALIDATSFEVRLTEAGLAPTTVAAVPAGEDEDSAIVLNTGSRDATILHVDAGGDLTTTAVTTHSGANAVAVTPSGRWAIAWTDAARFDEGELDPTEGLQDVTVIDLAGEPRATVLSVGYRPSRIAFDDAETRAFVVTEPGLSVLELDGEPRAEELVELTVDPVEQSARDVSITPDGELAVVRVDGTTTLGLVDLESGERTSVELDDFVTDLDLSRDGRRAFAVAGGELFVVPLPLGGAEPESFARAAAEGALARSVSLSPGGELALLYANAEQSPYLGIVTSDDDYASFAAHAVDLKAPVRAAFAAPDARHGIVLQATAPGSRKTGAFSIVSAQSDRAPKIIGTDAPPVQVAFAPDGSAAVIATRDLTNAVYGMYLVKLDNLEEELIELPSPPLAAGIVPKAERAFVSQAHPEGRITFVDLDDGSRRTLTGFELAAKVVE